MKKIKKVLIHCSACANGSEHDIKYIDRLHKKKGWKGVGYHYVLPVNGAIQQGRKESEMGAHCKACNKSSIGICLIGTDKFSIKQWGSLFILLEGFQTKYPDASIHGHREFANKLCPGFDVQKMLRHVF